MGVGSSKQVVVLEGESLRAAGHVSSPDKDVLEQTVVGVVQSPVGSSIGKRIFMYRSIPEDKSWAKSGVVAKVATGDSLLSIQKRVTVVGFSNVCVIRM